MSPRGPIVISVLQLSGTRIIASTGSVAATASFALWQDWCQMPPADVTSRRPAGYTGCARQRRATGYRLLCHEPLFRGGCFGEVTSEQCHHSLKSDIPVTRTFDSEPCGRPGRPSNNHLIVHRQCSSKRQVIGANLTSRFERLSQRRIVPRIGEHCATRTPDRLTSRRASNRVMKRPLPSTLLTRGDCAAAVMD
jgi:hypothetical protein